MFVGHTSIFGATDTPVSDFWWHLLWVSKPEWAALFKLCGGVRDIHSLRFISGVTPLLVYMASIATGHFPHMRVSAQVGCRIWTTDLQKLILLLTPAHVFYQKVMFSVFTVSQSLCLWGLSLCDGPWPHGDPTWRSYHVVTISLLPATIWTCSNFFTWDPLPFYNVRTSIGKRSISLLLKGFLLVVAFRWRSMRLGARPKFKQRH